MAATTTTAMATQMCSASMRSVTAPKLPQRGMLLRQAVRRSQRAPGHRGSPVAVKAAAEPSGLVKIAESIGLPMDEPIFGFRPFAELWVGRLAMMGFLVSIIEEGVTGRGTLQQIGLGTPDNTLLYVICGLAVGATLAGTASTLNKARNGKLSNRDLARYRSFLGMKNEAREIAATAKAMKLTGDFTSPDNEGAINAARSAGTSADTFLSPTNDGAVATAAATMKAEAGVFTLDNNAEANKVAAALKAAEARQAGPSVSLQARDDIIETGTFTSADWVYAKQVELDNGRWAMLGFLAAIIVEAATGNGIIMQLIQAAKWSGLLGVESGF